MDHALAWAVIGLVLVIAELLTGTFYLVMLGVAAFGAAGAAYLGVNFSAQVIVAALVAAIGCYGVHVYRAKNRTSRCRPSMPGIRPDSKAGSMHGSAWRASGTAAPAGMRAWRTPRPWSRCDRVRSRHRWQYAQGWKKPPRLRQAGRLITRGDPP